jgi:hypothetical protein
MEEVELHMIELHEAVKNVDPRPFHVRPFVDVARVFPPDEPPIPLPPIPLPLIHRRPLYAAVFILPEKTVWFIPVQLNPSKEYAIVLPIDVPAITIFLWNVIECGRDVLNLAQMEFVGEANNVFVIDVQRIPS